MTCQQCGAVISQREAEEGFELFASYQVLCSGCARQALDAEEAKEQEQLRYCRVCGIRSDAEDCEQCKVDVAKLVF